MMRILNGMEVKNFFAPNGYKLNGKVTWGGEDGFDVGRIEIEDNSIVIARLNFETFEIERTPA